MRNLKKVFVQSVGFICLSMMLQTALADDNLMQRIGVNLQKELRLKSTNESLILNGYALYHRWGDDVYLGALYTAKIEKRPKLILLNNDPVAMVYFFLQDDINPQLLNHIFTESVVNNNPDLNSREYDLQKFMQFKEMLKQSFNAGDILILEYSPKSQELVVYINGKEKQRWPIAKTFMNVFLNTWLGRYPPRQEFKRAILNFPTQK